MDPEACLSEAEYHFANNDDAEALRCLANYFRWRLKGGFPANDESALGFLDSIADSLDDKGRDRT